MSARCRENKLTSLKNRRNRQSAKKNKRREMIEKQRQERLKNEQEHSKKIIQQKEIPDGIHFIGTYARCKQTNPPVYFGWMRINRKIYQLGMNSVKICLILRHLGKCDEINRHKWQIDKNVNDVADRKIYSFVFENFITEVTQNCAKITEDEFNNIKKTENLNLCK